MARLLLGLLIVAALAVPSLAEDPAPSRVTGISLEMEAVPAAHVVNKIATAAKVNVILSPDIAMKPVTVAFHGVPWRVALGEVADQAGGAVVEEAHGIIRMVLVDKLQRVNEYYRFRHLEAPRRSTGSAGMPEAVASARRLLPPGSSLRYVPADNAIIVSARHDHASALIAMLKAIDRPASPGARPTVPDRRAYYEAMLRDSETETAAKYFVDRIGKLRAPASGR